MKNLSAVHARLSALPMQAGDALSRTVRDAALEALNEARRTVPVRTGALRASLDVRDRQGGGMTLLARRPYALYVEVRKPYLSPAIPAGELSRRACRALEEVLP